MAENKVIEQSKNFLSNLSTMQKWLFGAVAGALVLVGAYFALSLNDEQVEMGMLYKSLDPAEASKIIDYLKTSNIPYQLTENGTSILVDKTKIYDTRITLAGQGLPESGVVGYELFDKTNLGMSEFVQKLNHKRALEGELARTITSLEEVKRVRVHIVIPDRALFKKDQRPPTASVTLHLNSPRSSNKLNIEGIQNLVASSIEGMKVDDVSVVDQRGKLLSESPFDESTLAGRTALQHEQQRRVEQHLTSKVQSMLDNVIGTGNSSVEVNAALDFTSIEKTVTDYDPDKQVVRSEQSIVEKSASSDSLSYPAVNMSKDQANNIQNYEISKSVEHIVNSVGNISRLSVAVMINGTHEVITTDEGLKEMKYVPREEEEMQQFRDLVQNAIGFAPERGDKISVLNIPFDTSWEEDALEIVQEIPWWKIEENQKLILLGIAILLTMIIFWRVLRSKLIKERMRIALSLPAEVTMGLEELEMDEDEDDDDDVDDEEEFFEELDLDEDEMMLLPAELPEQLLLEGEKLVKEKEEEMELDESDAIDSESLAARARASLENADAPELTEEALMKIEIKQKVESFLDEETEEGVKLIRLMLSQDLDLRNY